jgi:hypothetical protein
MNRIEITYGEFIRTINPNFIVDMEFSIPAGIFVETGQAHPTPILMAIVKSPVRMISIELETGYAMVVSEGHMFKYDDKPISALDAEFIDSSYGYIKIINKTYVGEFPAYDIGIPAPHWYVNDENCIYHHNSNFCLLLAKAYLDKYADGICIFMDNEFGAAQYFDAMGIDKTRVIHVPVSDIEDLKQKHVQMLSEINRGDHVIFFLDSLSQIASLKESTDAQDGKVVADMTRAKMINSYIRIITPRLTMKNIPFLVINNFYEDTTNKYAEPIIKGGSQILLSSDTILMVTRSQVKDEDKSLVGWDFNYSAMKSRTVVEKSKFTINVLYDGGININSGLFELALEFGYLVAPKQGWYSIHLPGVNIDKLVRRKDIEAMQQFFDILVKNEDFKTSVENKYSLGSGDMFKETVDKLPSSMVDPETGEILTE